ncbi:wax ester/triacylglycerol synthase family O-acyltransferase [Ideonella sp.]|uniref:wax ester/triacylglycerol synthase family O-acyltransferase n=1 Tax=Ideonella sp. TaxID=1929293 RepID=UPI002B49EE6D|nr:wax ester/triacylglycerol synthase family O-acyltransferase [Ideonella sp.]HJV71431.1 wax ester/triacylglycerol synthase family O-acyltransferase [Ideonella sp.]
MTETSERMSRVDTAWLRMDSERNLMMIVGVWLLRPALDPMALRRRLEAKLLGYARFRQKVVQEAVLSYWVEDEDFRIDRHVVAEKLARRRGRSEREALQQRASELATTPLDHAHPLWQMHVFDHYEDGSAVIVRIHHCIADGIALNAVLMSIMDGGTDLRPPSQEPAPGGQGGGWVADELIKPLTGLTVKAIGLYGDGLVKAMDYLAHPEQSVAESAELLRNGARVLRDAAALALLPDDSPTLLKGKLNGRKVVAWCEPLPLDQVKSVGKALKCSVNDVLLSCVAGSIGRYLRDHGEDPAGKEIRAMVPVNLRPLEDAWQLGNRFGLAPVVLPVGIENPIERLYEVRDRMQELKGSYQPLLAYALLAVSGVLTKPLQDAISNMFLRKTTAVMTNVQGLAKPVKICGSTVRQSIFWVPSSGDVGVGVSIVSYVGGVQFGLITDSRRCPDPQRIIERFAPEFETLLLMTLMLPWATEASYRSGAAPWTPPGLR